MPADGAPPADRPHRFEAAPAADRRGGPRVGLLTLAALAPFAVAPLFPSEVDPWFRTALLAVGLAGALALCAPGTGGVGTFGIKLTALALLPLALSTWGSVDPGASRDRLVDFALWIVAFRLARDLLGAGRRRALLGVLAAVGAATAVYALYQRFFGLGMALEQLAAADLPDAGLAEAMSARLASGRVFATFILPSAFAGYLLMSLPLTVVLALQRRSPPAARAAWAGAAGLQAAALFLTLSHGAWASLALALLLAGLLAGPSRLRRWSLGGAAAAAALLLMVGLARGEALRGGGWARNPVAERAGNWKVALAQLREHPVAGVGWGAFGAAYTPHRRPGMNQTRYAHNTYLQLVAEGGLPVLPFVILLPVWAGSRLRRRQADAGEHGMRIAVAAVLLHNAIDFTLLLPGVALPFFGLVGALASGGEPAAAAARRGRAAMVPLALALVGLGLPAALAASAAAQARAAVVDGRAALARERIARAVGLDPWTAEYRDFLARWELQHGGDGAAQRARRAAEEACRLAPLVPHHRTTLELACRAAGDPACAYRAAARAAALYPSSPEYARRLQALQAELAASP